LNFEFIQEMQVKTGGYEAEFGRSTGGIINVITKSGGNQFAGDAFGYYQPDSLQSNFKELVSTGGTTKSFAKKDYGADVGGFILRDKLWFFAAMDPVRDTRKVAFTTDSGATIATSVGNRNNYASAKLTLNLAPS